MSPLYFCVGFALLTVLFVGMVARNMTKFMSIESFDDAKSRVSGHLVYGALAGLSSMGFVVSLIFAIIDYIKQ